MKLENELTMSVMNIPVRSSPSVKAVYRGIPADYSKDLWGGRWNSERIL